MEATLKPISTHISRKTGRLLGTQATTITAGMKSWERSRQAFEERSPQRGGREQPVRVPHREAHENRGLFSNPQQERLP